MSQPCRIWPQRPDNAVARHDRGWNNYPDPTYNTESDNRTHEGFSGPTKHFLGTKAKRPWEGSWWNWATGPWAPLGNLNAQSLTTPLTVKLLRREWSVRGGVGPLNREGTGYNTGEPWSTCSLYKDPAREVPSHYPLFGWAELNGINRMNGINGGRWEPKATIN